MSNKLIEFKLKTLRDFQSKYPTSHVGGSIGLMLHGVSVHRDLSISDLDITIDDFKFDSNKSTDFEERSDNNDFDYCLKTSESGYYTKIDIRVNPEPSFEQVVFNGIVYNVSKLRDIIFWKNKYADKGSIKHQHDLIAIDTGVRPELQPVSDDDLLF
jgi:hypothetical protein